MELRAQSDFTDMYRANALGGAKRFFKGFWDFWESYGRARAAAELARRGYLDEAKSLIIKDRF